MNLATYATRNLVRRRGRTILTVIAVTLAVLIFALIRTVVAMWNVGADAALHDRLATRHKASITMSVPKHYIDDVRAVPGVRAATWASWFAGKDPKKRIPFFATFAADQDSWFDVYDDMQVEPAVLELWKKTKNGAILGDILAKTLEVKVGDHFVINSDIFGEDWEFTVVGLYKPLRRTVDRAAALLPGAGVVEAGGDAVLKGAGPDRTGWMVEVEDPADHEHVLLTLRVTDRAVATSAPNRRRWRVGDEVAHHLIDPRTGSPSGSDLAQVTALAATAEEADVVAKVAFLLGAAGAARLLARPGYGGVLVDRHGEVRVVGAVEVDDDRGEDGVLAAVIDDPREVAHA